MLSAAGMLRSVSVSVPADPLALFGRIEGRPNSFVLWSADGSGPSYLGCDPSDSSTALDPEPDLPERPFSLGEVPRWVGLLPYEARRALERGGHDARAEPHHVHDQWYRFGAVARIDRDVRIVGDDARAIRHLSRLLEAGPAPRLGPPRPAVEVGPSNSELHAERIRSALSLIAAGDLYQVNLARRLEFQVEAAGSALLGAMGRRAPGAYSAGLCFGNAAVFSTSPELLLHMTAGGELTTEPIKGTLPRPADAADRAAAAERLDRDVKERAELAMILDVERNDLGRVAEPGSVVVAMPPHVRDCGSVLHRVAAVHARRRAGCDRADVLRAMVPSGSVTGAPKVRAMQVIAAHETHRRGIYTGGFGALQHDGGVRLGMAIRTLTVRDGQGHYFCGGGIVADSRPDLEVTETDWKSVQVRALLGGGP